MNSRTQLTSVLASMALLVTLGLLAGRAYGVPDCDGSTPKQANCGSAAACQNPVQNPQTMQWYCPNQAIVQQFIQHQCNTGSGTGSTLCGATSQQLVCTKRFTCDLTELRNPETNEVTVRLCAQAMAGGVNNSNAAKTDYITCQDTSGT